MRTVMAPAEVRTRDDRVLNVRWTDTNGRSRSARVARVVDDWDYLGRWWVAEVRRHYQLLETEDGHWLEVFREDGRWWVSRANG